MLTEQQIENLAKHHFEAAVRALVNPNPTDAQLKHEWDTASASGKERYRVYARTSAVLCSCGVDPAFLDAAPF